MTCRSSKTYRASRRNSCRDAGGVWPKAGVQLDPVTYKVTGAYAKQSRPTTVEMFKAGAHWMVERVKGRSIE